MSSLDTQPARLRDFFSRGIERGASCSEIVDSIKASVFNGNLTLREFENLESDLRHLYHLGEEIARRKHRIGGIPFRDVGA